MVTAATTALLVIVYAPREVSKSPLQRVVDVTADRMRGILGGSLSRALVLDDQDGV